MDDGIRIDEVDLDGEIPLRGKAVLIELSESDGYDHITVSYDPPNGGESFGTVDVRQLDGVGTVAQTLESATMILRLDGYELIVPGDFYLSM